MDSTQYAAAVAANVETAINQATPRRSVQSIVLETGIPRTTLDRRLRSNGHSPFSVAELKLIADVLGTTANALSTVYESAESVPA